MLEEKKREILDKNYLINKRKNVRLKTHFLAVKNRYFIFAIISSIIIVIMLYLISPSASVFKVIIKGNNYLNDMYYQELSGISDKDKYLLVITPLIERKMKADPIIESVSVKHLDHQLIEINVKEKEIIGYTYDDIPNLILIDGTKLSLDDKYLHLISKVPLIEGYNDEELKTISSGFKKLNKDMINEISEIHRYPFSYDDKMLEVIMRDGNYVYLSYYGLSLLNDYYSIASGINYNQENVCIFLDDVTNSGYVSECPYWKDDGDKDKNDADDNSDVDKDEVKDNENSE